MIKDLPNSLLFFTTTTFAPLYPSHYVADNQEVMMKGLGRLKSKCEDVIECIDVYLKNSYVNGVNRLKWKIQST